MTVLSMPAKGQLTLDLEPGLLDRHPTAMDCLRAAVYAGHRPLKSIAADMDMASSTLSRKLAQDPDDPRRFSVDDLEAYVHATGDTTVITYLAAKYLQTDADRRAAALANAERLLAQLAPALAALRSAA